MNSLRALAGVIGYYTSSHIIEDSWEDSISISVVGILMSPFY